MNFFDGIEHADLKSRRLERVNGYQELECDLDVVLVFEALADFGQIAA